MGDGCSCCKACCYSTPYATIFALSVTVVGLVGFLSSSVYSVVLISEVPLLKNHTIIVAPIVGGVAGSTILPLLIATVLAYCVTGYVRDELYHPFIKACAGPSCSVWIMVLVFLYFLLWLCLSVVLSLVMAVYIQLVWACPTISADTSPETRFTFFVGDKENSSISDSSQLQVSVINGDTFCTDGQRIGLALAISLGFSLIVIVGMVLVLVVQAANFVSVRESNKRSYRPGGDY